MRPARFAAVNLISDPIHGYIELTKRLAPAAARAAGFPVEEAAEEDILDSTWLQRLRRISQLQSARWVFPTAEHSRFTHGLGVMHEAGLWGRQLYPSLVEALAAADPGMGPPSEGLVVETLRVAGLLHDVGHGPFAHFFDDHVLAAFPAPPDRRRPDGKPLTHEDLSQLIIERELGTLIGRLRRAPGDGIPARDAFAAGEAIDPAWVAYLVAKPPLDDPGMPRWVRWLQPLFSGVFTVDNLDYVRRDAYLTGVSAGPVDAERLRRYAFVSERGLTLYEPGLAALEMFLTARLFMYQQVYFHRTVRGIDLDLAEVFGPSIAAIFGEASPADDLRRYADLDEYALLHQAARWARGEDVTLAPAPGSGQVAPHVAGIWRRILLRRPRWRAEAEIRAEYESGPPPADAVGTLGVAEPGRVTIDLAVVDARPAGDAADALLAVAGRDGRPTRPLAEALARLPAYALIGRRYVRTDGEGERGSP
jgi:HD superfamily phosphohydrolase